MWIRKYEYSGSVMLTSFLITQWKFVRLWRVVLSEKGREKFYEDVHGNGRKISENENQEMWI